MGGQRRSWRKRGCGLMIRTHDLRRLGASVDGHSNHTQNSNAVLQAVDSTSLKCPIQNILRVADCKHGFESRWGHHGDFVVLLAPEFSSPAPGPWASCL